MVTRFFQALMVCVSLLFTFPAFAVLELNIGYQGLLSSSGSGNWTGYNGVTYSYTGAFGLQADVRANLPTSDLQFGLRYGQLGLSSSQSGNTLQMNATTYSALLAYRLINTGVLFGPVVTYALGGSGTLENTLASTGSASSSAGSVGEYTAGLELGIKFPFLLSVEFGYANLTMSSFSNSQTLNGSSTSVALGGTYARASVGVTF